MSASQHPEVAAADVVCDPRRVATPARIYARSLTHPVLETVDDRIDHIRELMATRVWTPETTGELQEALSKRWGVAEATIRGYSTAASRMIRDVARDLGGMYALTALDTLAQIAEQAKDSPIPGDKNAARGCAQDLLKFAGLLEPEEDKSRPTTLIQVGQVVTSPVFGALLAGHEPKKLNGHTNGANGQTNGHAEGSDVVPNGGSNGAVGRKT